MVYEGTPHSNYLIQLPRTGTGDVNWQKEFPVHNYSGKSCQDALSTQNTSQQPQHHKRVSAIIHRDAPQTPLIRNSRSTTDPKTQKCAADRHCKIQQIPMIYKGTPNSSYLIQLPRTGTGDVNWQNGYPQLYIETPYELL